MKFYNADDAEVSHDKMMMWLLQFIEPGEGSGVSAPPSDAVEKPGEGQWESIPLASQSERIIAMQISDEYGEK